MDELKLPEWVNPKKTLIILSGKELVAYKIAKKPWRVKTKRCNQCGECCLDFPKVPFGCDDEGKCNKLQQQGGKWICTAGSDTPKRCLADPTDGDRKAIGCSIEYAE